MACSDASLRPGAQGLLCLGAGRFPSQVLRVGERTVTVRPHEKVSLGDEATALLLLKNNGCTHAYFGYIDAREHSQAENLVLTRASNLLAKRVRAHVRVPVSLAADVLDPVRRSVFRTTLHDLSAGGTSFSTPLYLPMGRDLALTVATPTGGPLALRGYVVHSAFDDEEASIVYGVAFDPEGPVSVLLQDFLKSHAARSAPARA